MNQEEIVSAARAFVLEEFLPGVDPSELTNDMPLISGGVLNSLATTRLVAFLEERFGIQIEAHEMGADALDTIDQIAALVTEKSGAAAD
jgi:acyl carrier protein